MKLGQKFTKELAENAGGQTGFIRGFKDGDTTIRFLNEMDSADDSWTFYREHYDPQAQVSYPCLGEKDICPGCSSANERERRASGRYLVNALNSEGYVNLYRVPQSIINSFVKYAERDGTITARDYTVSRSGSGLSTAYTVLIEDKVQVDVGAYRDQMQDHQEALANAFVEAWGSSPSEVAEQMARGFYPKKVGGRDLAQAPEEDTKQAPHPADSDLGDPPFEGGRKVAEDASGDDVIEYSRDDLLKMNGLQLRKVYRQAGIEWPEDAGEYETSDLVDYLMGELM